MQVVFLLLAIVLVSLNFLLVFIGISNWFSVSIDRTAVVTCWTPPPLFPALFPRPFLRVQPSAYQIPCPINSLRIWHTWVQSNAKCCSRWGLSLAPRTFCFTGIIAQRLCKVLSSHLHKFPLQRGTGVEKGGPHNLRFYGERPQKPDFILHTVKNLKIFLSRFCTFLEELKLQSIKIIICLIVSSKNIKNFKNKVATLFWKGGTTQPEILRRKTRETWLYPPHGKEFGYILFLILNFYSRIWTWK